MSVVCTPDEFLPRVNKVFEFELHLEILFSKSLFKCVSR